MPIIHKPKKLLVLRLKDPGRVTAVIPKSKTFTYNGKEFVAIHHGVEETQVLRNLGIDAPSPISFYYDWPRRSNINPFLAQHETAAFLTLNNRAFILNDLGCVDADTEYLSPTGWVRIADYAGGQVAQYWPKTGAVEFVEPLEYVKRPCDLMIRIKTKYGIDQLLSPEHRVLLQSRTNPEKQEVVQAEELLRRHDLWLAGERPKKSLQRIGYTEASIPVVFSARGGAGLDVTDVELRVQVAVIADGHYPNGTNRCVVRLKKQRKKERLRRLLSEAAIEWSEYEQNTPTAQGYTVFSFAAPMRKKVFDADFWAATAEQLRVIADEVLHWDSCMGAGSRGDRFSSYEKASADFVQYAMCATGRTARVLEFVRGRRGAIETEYVVQIRNEGRPLQLKGTTSCGARKQSMWWEPSTDGFKYCFMVPSTFLLFRRNGCVFASGNTGKTLATLWGYDYLRSVGVVRKAMVVTPLSTLERTWADEVFNHFPHLTTVVLHGARGRRLKLLEEDADLYLINHDGVKVPGLVEALAHRADIDLVIVDEIAQVARNASTGRYKALNTIINKQVPRRAWGLTATPTPNAPTDAWAQCRLLVPERVPPYFNRFKDTVMRQISQFIWVPRPNAMEIVREAMQPAVRFTRDECIDLPPCLYQPRTVELTPAQAKAYKEMLTKLKAEAESGDILAVNEAVKAQKLIQIACGVAYGSEGQEVVFDAGPRLEVVREVIEQAGTKVIVFVPFVSVVQLVAEHLTAHGISVGVIHGGVGKSERDRVFGHFQKAAEPQVIVAQPAAMSHGLTLTAASTIVWYAPVTSNEVFEQANGRITRPGQKNTQVIVMIEGTDMERKYYQRLREKQKVQGLLLDMVQEQWQSLTLNVA